MKSLTFRIFCLYLITAALLVAANPGFAADSCLNCYDNHLPGSLPVVVVNPPSIQVFQCCENSNKTKEEWADEMDCRVVDKDWYHVTERAVEGGECTNVGFHGATPDDNSLWKSSVNAGTSIDNWDEPTFSWGASGPVDLTTPETYQLKITYNNNHPDQNATTGCMESAGDPQLRQTTSDTAEPYNRTAEGVFNIIVVAAESPKLCTCSIAAPLSGSYTETSPSESCPGRNNTNVVTWTKSPKYWPAVFKAGCGAATTTGASIQVTCTASSSIKAKFSKIDIQAGVQISVSVTVQQSVTCLAESCYFQWPVAQQTVVEANSTYTYWMGSPTIPNGCVSANQTDSQTILTKDITVNCCKSIDNVDYPDFN